MLQYLFKMHPKETTEPWTISHCNQLSWFLPWKWEARVQKSPHSLLESPVGHPARWWEQSSCSWRKESINFERPTAFSKTTLMKQQANTHCNSQVCFIPFTSMDNLARDLILVQELGQASKVVWVHNAGQVFWLQRILPIKTLQFMFQWIHLETQKD